LKLVINIDIITAFIYNLFYRNGDRIVSTIKDISNFYRGFKLINGKFA